MNNEISYELLYGEPFSQEDFDCVDKLLKQLYTDLSSPRKLTPERYFEVTSASHVFVARTSKNKIIGMASIIQYAKLSREAHWVEDVVVHRSYRGRGICTGLMKKIEWFADVTGIKVVDLHSRRENAIRLYEKLGYVKRESTLMRLTIK